MSDWVGQTLAAMTFEEKVALLAGANLWETHAIDRLGVPSIRVTDGPNGARGSDGNHGPTSTSFPVGIAMGATFDPDLIEEVGRALAHETRSKGSAVLLGPTVNIQRIPNAGRNFECFSEDPFLSGTMAASYIIGLQSGGVAACIKHFVCNDQEQDRFTIDARVDTRALREIYLEPFRIAVQAGRPWSAMSAYNTINGVTASEHPMLDEILRREFGFDGAVISDWYGTYSAGVVGSGLDLEMPGPARWMAAGHVETALGSDTIQPDDIDRKVERLLTLIERTGGAAPEAEQALERPQDRALVRRVAAESAVLLKNDGVLPLNRNLKVALIGELAGETPHQGGGSSSVNPHRVVSIVEGFQEQLGEGTSVVWAPGPPTWKNPPPLPPASLSHAGGSPGFLVEYFDNPDLAEPSVRTVTTSKSFLAFFGGGDAWVDHDQFSLRVSGQFEATLDGVHAFAASAGGSLRVTANDQVVVDAPSAIEGVGPHGWELDLQAGDIVDLTIEYATTPGDRWRWVGIGCEVPGPADPITDAVAVAENADVAVVVVGLTPEWESEGFDRPDLLLPGRQNDLVRAVVAAQPNTVVVVVAGSAVEMPWLGDVGATLHVWYGGQEIGHAVADVLYGAVDPGGRLPVTFPRDSRQHPGLLNYPGEAGVVRYGEGVYVGYRGFDRLGLTPMFPFGYGLSYASFRLAQVEVETAGNELVVGVQIENASERPGTEVVQVFALDLAGLDRKLVGFSKIRIPAKESVNAQVSVSRDALRWWDPTTERWESPSGLLALRVSGTFGSQDVTVDLAE
ncbi:MAG: glycoside hydrolase family 3 C-terminal domain-containing protein [Acidimicrobiia bacterium]|nr:glycoside hydrolase family 3 C-terminal domain-containing protein [Acidimicrobiia bacterium]